MMQIALLGKSILNYCVNSKVEVSYDGICWTLINKNRLRRSFHSAAIRNHCNWSAQVNLFPVFSVVTRPVQPLYLNRDLKFHHRFEESKVLTPSLSARQSDDHFRSFLIEPCVPILNALYALHPIG
jgi:hypothetical protein